MAQSVPSGTRAIVYRRGILLTLPGGSWEELMQAEHTGGLRGSKGIWGELQRPIPCAPGI